MCVCVCVCVYVGVQDLTKKSAAAQKGKKRSHEDQESFFCWFSDHGDPGSLSATFIDPYDKHDIVICFSCSFFK